MPYFPLNPTSPSLIASSKWNGKLWEALGDSNTELNNGTAQKKYTDIIQEKTGCIVKNRGSGGRGWGSPNNFYDNLNQLDDNADLITVLGGGNDYAHGVPLGTLGDTTRETFYGAVYVTLSTLINRYPLKTIAVIGQMRRGSEVANSEGVTVEQYADATYEVCKKLSIPFLDLYHHGNLYPWNSTFLTSCIPDGVHLNDLGQKIITSKIQTFLESL